MRELLLSNHEKDFITKSIIEKRRLDGRSLYDYRQIGIQFGVNRGAVDVLFGNTRVFAQVSCDIGVPRESRPNEGNIYINVDLSPMAAPQFETGGRQHPSSVEINRLLEKSVKDSRCVDTESLCIVAGAQVWNVRVDVHVLNHDGNLIDSCSLAAIAALSHFRRPDITVVGEDVIIHSFDEKDPVPLSVHHMPICVTFAFYNEGKSLLVDPTLNEESVMEGRMVIALNKHREVCTFQMTGRMLLLKEQVMRCTHVAVVKVVEMTKIINLALENDAKARILGKKYGFTNSIDVKKLTSAELSLSGMKDFATEKEEVEQELDVEDVPSDMEITEDNIMKLTKKTIKKMEGEVACAAHFEGGASNWDMPDEEEIIETDESMENEPCNQIKEEPTESVITQPSRKNKPKHKKKIRKG